MMAFWPSPFDVQIHIDFTSYGMINHPFISYRVYRAWALWSQVDLWSWNSIASYSCYAQPAYKFKLLSLILFSCYQSNWHTLTGSNKSTLRPSPLIFGMFIACCTLCTSTSTKFGFCTTYMFRFLSEQHTTCGKIRLEFKFVLSPVNYIIKTFKKIITSYTIIHALVMSARRGAMCHLLTRLRGQHNNTRFIFCQSRYCQYVTQLTVARC